MHQLGRGHRRAPAFQHLASVGLSLGPAVPLGAIRPQPDALSQLLHASALPSADARPILWHVTNPTEIELLDLQRHAVLATKGETKAQAQSHGFLMECQLFHRAVPS